MITFATYQITNSKMGRNKKVIFEVEKIERPPITRKSKMWIREKIGRKFGVVLRYDRKGKAYRGTSTEADARRVYIVLCLRNTTDTLAEILDAISYTRSMSINLLRSITPRLKSQAFADQVETIERQLGISDKSELELSVLREKKAVELLKYAVSLTDEILCESPRWEEIDQVVNEN